jgi:two-component system response regulator AtoC
VRAHAWKPAANDPARAPNTGARVTTKNDATVSLHLPALPAPAPGPRLLVFQGALPVPHKLTDGKTVVLGRADDVEIKVEHASLSRKHARVTVTGEQIVVEDLGSTNGTRVRGERIAQATPVNAGEVFHLGGVACAVELVSAKRGAAGGASDGSGVPTGKGKQSKAQQLQSLVDLVAASEISVFIHGETGSGKEVTARAIHAGSPRKAKPFVAFNCAALPDNLLESELFGYERGAFSGADRAKPGLLESAEGGTVFLDEIAEMAPLVQAKLLRVLEEREVQRLGALKPKKIDVRLVSASHRLLDEEVEAKKFRQDLYFRINGLTIEIPPLRERLAELDDFAAKFLDDAAKKAGRAAPQISPEAARAMRNHDWPGNLRELKNTMERALVLSAGGPILVPHLSLQATKGGRPSSLISDAGEGPGSRGEGGEGGEGGERERILAALQKAAGNQVKAAELLGISRRTLINRLEQHGIPRPRKG